jgi:hypothetical protein
MVNHLRRAIGIFVLLTMLTVLATLSGTFAADPQSAILGDWQKTSGPTNAPDRYTFLKDGSLSAVTRVQFNGHYTINADTILFKYDLTLPISGQGGTYRYKLTGDQLTLSKGSAATSTYRKTN